MKLFPYMAAVSILCCLCSCSEKPDGSEAIRPSGGYEVIRMAVADEHDHLVVARQVRPRQLAALSVLAGPVVFAEPADGLKGRFANEEVATWEVLNATEWALDEVTATEVPGDEG